MTNLFLKINKDLFKLGLNPTQLLVLAQVMEFNTNTGDCFISDKALSAQFGVSESTISREIKKLEAMGFITRETKNVKGGKERHMKVNTAKIEAALSSINLKVDGDIQASNCSLTNVNLPIVNKQNDLIKDNIKDKEKDNIEIDAKASISKNHPEEEVYKTVSLKEMVMYGVPYEAVDIDRQLYRILATNKIVRAVY